MDADEEQCADEILTHISLLSGIEELNDIPLMSLDELEEIEYLLSECVRKLEAEP